MNILFIHQNMPGQFKHLAPALAAQGHRVAFLTKRADVHLPGVERVTYGPPRDASPSTHAYVRRHEAAVRYGQQAARGILALKQRGFTPDLVIAHPGWGESLFVKDICPKARLINYCEFFYAGQGLDVGFDPDEPATLNSMCQARSRNAHLLLSLEACDVGVSPTQWQKSVHPAVFHPKIELIFDGIDLKKVAPRRTAELKLPSGECFRPGDKVITYVARNLEPYRGFRPFMRALPGLLRQHPDAHVLVVGGDEVSYGSQPRGFANWREAMLAEVDLDLSRVHFLGKLPYDRYLDVLAVSAAHVYLTYPFVLSWSCFEAMAMGCLLIGSDTPPVRELIEHDRNGLLVDFFDPDALANAMSQALVRPESLSALRAEARRTIEARYSLKHSLAAWGALVDDQGIAGTRPSSPRRTIALALPARATV